MKRFRTIVCVSLVFLTSCTTTNPVFISSFPDSIQNHKLNYLLPDSVANLVTFLDCDASGLNYKIWDYEIWSQATYVKVDCANKKYKQLKCIRGTGERFWGWGCFDRYDNFIRQIDAVGFTYDMYASE